MPSSAEPNPTGAAALRAIALAVYRAGYDANDNQSMDALAEHLRFLRERQETKEVRQKRTKAIRAGCYTFVATALAGSILSQLGGGIATWLARFFPASWFWHSGGGGS